MLYFYNPETKERINEVRLYNIYGVTPETAEEKGWKRFSLIQIDHNRRFHYLEDMGEVEDGQGGYMIKWEQRDRNVALVKEELKKDVAAKRYDVETDGVKLADGSIVRTDRESQAALGNAKIFSDLAPDALIDWKGSNGWVKIDRAALIATATAVATHVQQCFTHEKELVDLIDAAETIDDLKTVDIQAGWPESAGVNKSAIDLMRPFGRI